MFIIPDDKVDFIKKNGIYDYITDIEDEGKLNDDDKEDIYQYFLSQAQEHMTEEEYSKFIDGLVNMLKLKKSVGSWTNGGSKDD